MKHLYIIFLVLPLIGFGQGWEQTYGGEGFDEGFSVQQTTDGGYIITGSFQNLENINNSQMGRELSLIKISENGEEEWFQTYSGSYQGNSIKQTNDGGYIICGIGGICSNGSSLIKTDGNGEQEWFQCLDNNQPSTGVFTRSLQKTDDGGYIITGSVFTFYNEDSDIYITKIDENGNELWNQTFGDTNGDEGYSVQQTTDGGYIICGKTLSYLDNFIWDDDLYIIKTNDSGVEEWSQLYGETVDFNNWGNGISVSSDVGNCIEKTDDGGYIICGVTNPYQDNNKDIWLMKIDENGEEEWSQTFGDEYSDIGYSVKQTTDGGYIITGEKGFPTTDGLGNNDVYLIKTNDNGIEEWSQTFGGEYNDVGYSVEQTSDGGYIICGRSETLDSNYNMYLIKTDSQGNVTSTIELPTPTSKRELVKTTNILGQENTTIKNQPLIEIYDDGSTEKKIVLE